MSYMNQLQDDLHFSEDDYYYEDSDDDPQNEEVENYLK